MDRFALGMAVIALALAGLAVWQRPDAPVSDPMTPASAELADRIERLSARIDAFAGREASRVVRPPAATPDSPGAMEQGASGPTLVAPPMADSGGRETQTLEDRLAAIEAEIETLSAKGGPFRSGLTRQLVADAASAEQAWGLTPRQRLDVDAILEDGKRQIEALMDLPNDSGVTLRETLSSPSATIGGAALEDGSGGTTLRILTSGAGAFKNGKIPGSNETYAQAEQRIRSDLRRRLRDVLDERQRASFDESEIEPLLPRTGGDVFSIAFTTATLTTPPGN